MSPEAGTLANEQRQTSLAQGSEVDRPDDGLLVAGVAVPRLPPELRSQLAERRLAVVDPSDAVRRLIILFAVLAASTAVAVVVQHPATWVAHAVVAGLVLTSLIAAEHEALHGSMFDSPWANHVVGAVCGALCLTPYSAYRTYHLKHHQNTRVPGDVEPIVVVRSRPGLIGALFAATIGLAAVLWARLFASLVGRGFAGERRFRRPAIDRLSAVLSIGFLVVVVLIGMQWGVGFVALLVGAPLAVYNVLSAGTFFPEHYECAYGPDIAWNTTRTTVTNPLTRFLMWNANFHTAHHLVPAVPCHALPELQELIAERCIHTESGYLGYYRGLWGRIARGELPPAAPWKA
ncbi:MAG: fatty acid desaturase [Actinomycetota bacterium]|nr:fatty acid desaturase [Actinomycetota bacterium]